MQIRACKDSSFLIRFPFPYASHCSHECYAENTSRNFLLEIHQSVWDHLTYLFSEHCYLSGLQTEQPKEFPGEYGANYNNPSILVLLPLPPPYCVLALFCVLCARTVLVTSVKQAGPAISSVN